MYKKVKIFAFLGVSILAIANCGFRDRSLQEVINDPLNEAASPSSPEKNVELATLQMPRSIVVCRSKQCAPIKLSMSKEYIYNSLVQMFENNNNQKALVCAADTNSHNCYQNYVSLPINVGVTPAYMYVDSVKISDVKLSKGKQNMSMMLHYNVTYNGQTPNCAPDKTLLYVKNTDNIIVEDEGYRCKMTTIGSTTIKTLFLIDYIDLDYGFIGGHYSIGLSGPAYGGGTGYMLLRLSKTGYPLRPLPKELQEAVNPKAAKSEFMEGKDPTAKQTSNASGVEVFPIKR